MDGCVISSNSTEFKDGLGTCQSNKMFCYHLSECLKKSLETHPAEAIYRNKVSIYNNNNTLNLVKI